MSAYENYVNDGVLPDEVELISPKNCLPILEYSIVIFNSKVQKNSIVFNDCLPDKETSIRTSALWEYKIRK